MGGRAQEAISSEYTFSRMRTAVRRIEKGGGKSERF